MSAGRICRLFEITDTGSISLNQNSAPESADLYPDAHENYALELKSSSFHWSLSDIPVLSDISLRITKVFQAVSIYLSF